MVKIDGIYRQIVSKDNLYRAAYMASRGRRFRDTTADFNFRLEEEICGLHRELITRSYRHGEYRLFNIYEPKERMIAAAPFKDRVVHHAVHDVIDPIIDKTFIYDSYACRKGKGTHTAIGRVQGFLRRNSYCFHGDIRKYFRSINHEILKNIIRQKIADQGLLWLLDEIIDSAKHIPLHERRGLPIGNLTSQFFANLYLNELDYFIKFDLKAKFYLRYMDDFLVFDNNKKALLGIKEKIRDFLKNRLGLDMHEGKSQIYKTKDGIKFLGFRIFKNYRRLTSDNVRRFRKRLKKLIYLFENNKMDTKEICDSVRCWVAHSKYANTKGLRLNIWNNLVNPFRKGSICKGDFSNRIKDILLDGVSINSERERERE